LFNVIVMSLYHS